MKIKTHRDLRADARIDTEMTVICQPYTSCGSERSARGKMRNFSSQGAYIEIDRKFKSGTIIIVRTTGALPTRVSSEHRDKPRSICLGEIKWRQDVLHALKAIYGIGLKYFN
jgi:hypothetical protein